MTYKITFKRSAYKELLKKVTPRDRAALIEDIDQLQIDPRPDGVKKLKGIKEDLWRIRCGNYRVVYAIDEGIKIVNVRKVGHRREAYQKL